MKKTDYILSILCLISLLFGCTSSRNLSTIEAEHYSDDLEFLILHTNSEIWELHDYSFKYLTLEGIAKKANVTKRKSMHVYVGDTITIDANSRVSIKRNDIQKIIYNERRVDKSILIYLGIVVIIGALALVVVIGGSPPVLY